MDPGSPPPISVTVWRRLGLLLAAYTAALLVVVPRLPLWLDEVLGLIGVRYARLDSLIDYVSRMPGGVPLTYATQWAIVKLLGYSIYSGRLTSVVSSVLAAIGVFALARRLPIRHPLAAVLVYCLLPLQFRYALEARPYGLALCFSVWTAVCFFRLLEKRTAARTPAYALCVIGGLYSQPYTFFVPLAHVLWTLMNFKKLGAKFTGLMLGLVIGSGVAFLPWYLYEKSLWHETAASYHSAINWKSGLLILHELVGAGYVGTLVIVAASILGICRALRNNEERLLWSLYLAVPVAGAFAGDLFFGYFVAIRQVLFLVAPLALLSVLGVESRPHSRSLLTNGVAAVVLLLTLIGGDISFLRRPREDWGAGAKLLVEAKSRGACVMFVPDSSDLYEFFEPSVSAARCTAESLQQVSEVEVAVNPYDAGQVPATVDRLRSAGFERSSVLNLRKPEIYVFRRAAR
jgi:hypothetical protein